MTTIEDVYDDLGSDISFEEFKEQVRDKRQEMGGLVDEDAAAVLVADGLTTNRVQSIDDIGAGMDEVEFLGKVLTIGELTTFERDDGEGRVCNIEVGDETGQIRVALWDDIAVEAVEELEVGEVLEVNGSPKDGYSGLEVSAYDVVVAEDAEIGIEALESYRVADLSSGLSRVTMQGLVLETTSISTFERSDGSEGQVANVIIGDQTGEVQVTMWGDAADAVSDYRVKQSVEVTNADVKDSDAGLELHINSPDGITHIKEQIKYVPETTPVAEAQLGDVVNLAGGITYLDEKRTFERDDGSSGNVRSLSLEDDSDEIRVTLWGDKAEMDLNTGDEILVTSAEITEGWEDEPEASTGYRSAVLVTGRGTHDIQEADEAGDEDDESTPSQESGSAKSIDEYDPEGDTDAGETATDEVEVTGTVLGVGSEVPLDTSDGEVTVTADDGLDVRLGETITVRGTRTEDGKIVVSEVR